MWWSTGWLVRLLWLVGREAKKGELCRSGERMGQWYHRVHSLASGGSVRVARA